MIAGIGCDLCSISRIEKALQNIRFLQRVYTDNERGRLDGLCASRRYERAAGMFAAKEAVAKALGTGFGPFCFSDIEILSDAHGRPCALLHGAAATLAGEAHLNVSISHESGFALAFAVLERRDD